MDIIRYYLKTLKLNVPKRVCVKVKYLRKEGIDNLEEWLNNGVRSENKSVIAGGFFILHKDLIFTWADMYDNMIDFYFANNKLIGQI